MLEGLKQTGHQKEEGWWGWEEHGYNLNLNPSSSHLLGGLKPITLLLTLNCFIFEVEITGAP